MENLLIVADTRQQKDNHITKYFDKNNIVWVRDNLPSADYMAIRYKDNNFIKDYSVLIDTKKDLVELAHNLCNSSEHARVVREIETARNLGCKEFYFIISENKIKTAEDIKNWKSKYTKVSGSTLLKVMATFSNHHNCKFIIVPKKEVAPKIITLLQNCKKYDTI